MRRIQQWIVVLGVMAVSGLTGTLAQGQVERADIGPSHAGRQLRPVMLGVTGGNIKDRTGNLVSGGTIGAMVHDKKGNLYLLGNSHILGCLNKAKAGDGIVQPSLVDHEVPGTQNPADAVAWLSKYVKIKFNKGKSKPLNTVDAAMAAIVPGKVRTDGYILDVGVPSAKTLKPKVGKAVRKSGRSSGLTQSTIMAVDVAVDVSFSNNSVSRFKKQFLINSGGFAAAGDGGALVVDDKTSSPRVIGLLFGGNSSAAVASPIGEVLKQLDVSLGGVRAIRAAKETADEEESASDALDYAVDYASAVKDRFEDKLMAIDNVVGHGVALDPSGRPVIEIYLKTDRFLARSKIPSRLESIPTRIRVTGPFKGF